MGKEEGEAMVRVTRNVHDKFLHPAAPLPPAYPHELQIGKEINKDGTQVERG